MGSTARISRARAEGLRNDKVPFLRLSASFVVQNGFFIVTGAGWMGPAVNRGSAAVQLVWMSFGLTPLVSWINALTAATAVPTARIRQISTRTRLAAQGVVQRQRQRGAGRATAGGDGADHAAFDDAEWTEQITGPCRVLVAEMETLTRDWSTGLAVWILFFWLQALGVGILPLLSPYYTEHRATKGDALFIFTHV